MRLGELNDQTRWVLERAEVAEPRFLPHVFLRVRDVMREQFPLATDNEAVRHVGRLMARENTDLVPIVDDGGLLAGVMTERALARRYIRESRRASQLDAPTWVSAIVEVLEGELVAGEDRQVAGRVWVMAMDVANLPEELAPGDVDGRRRPRGRAAPGGRARRRPARDLQQRRAGARHPRRWPPSAGSRSSARRWTPT